MGKKIKYYSLDKLKEKDATYNICFGLRSNGKTYAVLKEGLLQYVETGKQLAIIRRWKEDFIGKRGQVMFAGLNANDEIRKATRGEWEFIRYYASKWYLARHDQDGRVVQDDKPLALAFSLSDMEHDKSTAYPDVGMILFDEFISREGYLKDEFVIFMNVISTIIRGRMDVKIYMMGNTVNKYCPYFAEMGLKHISQMRPGQVDVYRYGDSRLTVAVEYAEPLTKSKKQDNAFYFAFDNPKLQMITSGAWEIDIYPHLPFKYKPKDIIFQFFIIFAGHILHCEIINAEGCTFTYIHKKTTPLQDGRNLVYTPEVSADPLYRRNILKPCDKLDEKVYRYFKTHKVFYQDNELGEVVRNYLMWCGSKAL